MKKFILLLTGLIFVGCAGSVANPYFAPDIYGQRKHIYEEGVSLIEIKETHRNNVYNFRFYENVLASSPQIEMAKKNTIKNYYDEYAKKNGYSSYRELGVTLVTGWQNSYKHKVEFYRTSVADNETLDNYSNSRNIFKEQLIPNAASELVNILEKHSSSNNNLYSSSYLNSPKGCHVFGKIKFVDIGEDYKVKFVTMGENLKVKYNSININKVGNWKIVEIGENYKLKQVDFGEDFKVKIVDIGEGCN